MSLLIFIFEITGRFAHTFVYIYFVSTDLDLDRLCFISNDISCNLSRVEKAVNGVQIFVGAVKRTQWVFSEYKTNLFNCLSSIGFFKCIIQLKKKLFDRQMLSILPIKNTFNMLLKQHKLITEYAGRKTQIKEY